MPKPHFSFRCGSWCLGLVLVAQTLPHATGQTLDSALDTPGRVWTATAGVTALGDPELAHDGVDVVRLPQEVPGVSLSTTLTGLSVVEFQHRSEGLVRKTNFRMGGQEITANIWRKEKRLVAAGTLEFYHPGSAGNGPLYLDEVLITPAQEVSLAAALDWPGGVSGDALLIGVAEPWLALDGVDAICALQPSLTVSVSVPAPGWVSFLSKDQLWNAGFGLDANNASTTKGSTEFENRTWVYLGEASTLKLAARATNGPWILDQVSAVPEVPLAEALDAPGRNFTVSGPVLSTSQTAGAADGDAVLALPDPVFNGTQHGRVSLTLTEPALVRFSCKGYLQLKRQGMLVEAVSYPFDGGWKTMEVPVLTAGEILSWEAENSREFWLNEVQVLPLPAGNSVAGLLGMTGLEPEFPVPVMLRSGTTGDSGEAYLRVEPETLAGPATLIRLPFTGPAVVSVELVAAVGTSVRVDDGAWQSALWTSGSSLPPPYVTVVPGPGHHFLEIGVKETQSISLRNFRVQPLQAVPLADALDAPGMTFATSPNTPWSGYLMPPGLGFEGNHAVTGGSHAAAEDPWIETVVQGPGVLRSTIRTQATQYTESPGSAGFLPQLRIDGGLIYAYGVPQEVWIGDGPHTVRWIQRGSQINSGTGTLALLDAVSFTPRTISFAEALETPGRTWRAGGSGGTVFATATPGEVSDGVDSVKLQEGITGGMAWLETEIQLPAVLTFSGKNLLVELADGTVLKDLAGTTTFTAQTIQIPGAGQARLRFRNGDQSSTVTDMGILDQVVLYESSNGIAGPVNLGTPGITWKEYSGKDLGVLLDEATGREAYRNSQTLWMEATVTGPCLLGGGEITLPDRNNRKVITGRIHYSGPQRVLMKVAAGQPIFPDNYRPIPEIGVNLATPGVTWRTGGDVPWIATTAGTAISGPVWPGEVSWVEAEVTGPGMFGFDLSSIGSVSEQFGYSLTVDGIGIPGPTVQGRWIHLGNGSHRLRWQAVRADSGVINDFSMLTLSGIVYHPQAEDSVSTVLSGGVLNFVEELAAGTMASAWPVPASWQVGMDESLPGKVVRAGTSPATRALQAIAPGYGKILSQLKMEQIQFPAPPDGTVNLPISAAPFDWNPAGGVWPLKAGYRTSIAAVSFAPATAVTVGEALDQPSLNWTAGVTHGGLWQPVMLEGNASDPDGLALSQVPVGGGAWVEALFTGPLTVTAAATGGNTSGVQYRFLVDDIPVSPDNENGSGVRVPAGQHLVRFEVKATEGLPGTGSFILTKIAATAVAAPPDVAALLDAPGLSWAQRQGNLTAAALPMTHDGVDALSLGGSAVLAISGNGPALVQFWHRGDIGSASGFSVDGTPVVLGNVGNTWAKASIPVPAGRHTLYFSPSSGGFLDEFSWQELPALPPMAAVNGPATSQLIELLPASLGAAAYPGLSDDGTGALLVMPSLNRPLEIRVPAGASLSFRCRSVISSASLYLQDLAAVPLTTSWATQGFSTPLNGGTTSVYLRVSSTGSPVMLDRLTVSVPAVNNSYGFWAASSGLVEGGNQPDEDPDGDGVANFLEYAFGLNPSTQDASKVGTATEPGLPEVGLYHDPVGGKSSLELRYWRRNNLSSRVEEAVAPDGTAALGQPDGWAVSSVTGTVTAPGPAGWSRVVWRSALPVSAGAKPLARVRVYLP